MTLTEISQAWLAEVSSGRALWDSYASVYRLAVGLFLAVVVGTPLGLLLGHSVRTFRWLATPLNFLRSISPLAWIPFAVVWFGVGDWPVVFLVFVGTVLPWIFSSATAVTTVPEVYFQVARDHRVEGTALFSDIIFPAMLPTLVRNFRVIATLAWVILVPAEMLAGREGLGFAIMDARNGMRLDLLIFNMLLIGAFAHLQDLFLARLLRHPTLRWGHAR